MNQASSHLSSRDTPRGCTKWKPFIEKTVRQEVMDNSEMKVNSEESKRSGEGSFSLAKLWCFHWLGLLLGGKKISSPVLVK